MRFFALSTSTGHCLNECPNQLARLLVVHHITLG